MICYAILQAIWVVFQAMAWIFWRLGYAVLWLIFIAPCQFIRGVSRR
jgi:hypothetical protein